MLFAATLHVMLFLRGPCAPAMTSPSLALHSHNSHSGSSGFPAGTHIGWSTINDIMHKHQPLIPSGKRRKRGSDLSPLKASGFKAGEMTARH